MSEDARKLCRTQGKYSDRNQHYDDIRQLKRFDKRHKGIPAGKEPQEKKFHKRKSDGGKESNTSLSSESESPIRYQENSNHSFSQLEDVTKAIEIKDPGKHILSSTVNGESVVLYDPCFFEKGEAIELMNRLRNTTNWHEKNIVIRGIEYPQPRLVAWYGPLSYTYSGATLEAGEMPDCVLEVKGKVEQYLSKNGIDVKLNSVLLNLYRHNKDSVSWHSDDELSMGVCPTIASVSLGETRRFEMRRKLKQPDDGSSYNKRDDYFVHLTNGSLLIMDGCMQKDWQHQVPKEYHDRGERINLTFRTVYEIKDLHSSPGSYSKNQPINNALKSCRSKADFDVYYDDENFPPLNSDNSPDAENKSQDAWAPGFTKTGKEFSGSYRRGNVENPSYGSTAMKTNNDITGSEDIWDSELSPCDKTTVKREKICKPEKTWSSKPTHNKTSLKTRDKINGSTEICDSEPFSCTSTSLTAVDKINETKEFWDKESSSCSENFKNAKMNGSNKRALLSSHNKKSTLLNNLNDNKSNVKIDMQSKNLRAYDSDFSSNNDTNNTANSRKNGNLSSDNHNVPTDSPVNNIRETEYEVEDVTTSKKDSGWTPNVEAKEFVPGNVCTSVCENPYVAFGIENLLNYSVDVMNVEALMDYSDILKNRVLEKINDFKFADKEELSMLCDLTDGDQTFKNQKIITARMMHIVQRAIRHLASPNLRKSYGNPRKPNHGNQNYHSERRYQSGSREGYQRY